MLSGVYQDMLNAIPSAIGDAVAGPGPGASYTMGDVTYHYSGGVKGLNDSLRTLYNSGQWMGPGLGIGGLGLSGAMGFMEDGFSGALGGISTDLGTAAGMRKYHYGVNVAKDAQPGQLLRPGLAQRKFYAGDSRLPSVTTKVAALNTAAYIGKTLVGGVGGMLGGGVGGAVGGTIGGATGFGFMETYGNISGTVMGSYLGSKVAIGAATSLANPVGIGLMVGAAAAAGATYGAYKTAQLGHSVLKDGYQHRQRQKQIHTSGSLAAFSTTGASTMRARAVASIAKSHTNARSALGQEASYMSFPSRSYSSPYRRHY